MGQLRLRLPVGDRVRCRQLPVHSARAQGEAPPREGEYPGAFPCVSLIFTVPRGRILLSNFYYEVKKKHLSNALVHHQIPTSVCFVLISDHMQAMVKVLKTLAC